MIVSGNASKGIKQMKLNCDLGEGFGSWKMGNDADIMPLIDQANIACGFHASDPLTMQKTIALAVANNVTIGAHPAYPDLVGFGRRSMAMSAQELAAIVQYQIAALNGLCHAQNTKVNYVKPHGALYNDMMKNDAIFHTLCKAIAALDSELVLVIQATVDNDKYAHIASSYQVKLWFEAFADRNYQDNGLLVPRTEKNAVINDVELIAKRVNTLNEHGYLLSENNRKLSMQVDTLCVHGDTENALDLVKSLSTLT